MRCGGVFFCGTRRVEAGMKGELKMRRNWSRSLGAMVVAIASLAVWAPQTVRAQAAAPAAEPVPKFDKAYMSNKVAIDAGAEVWTTQCRHCHGRNAYPGKAPKLSPGGYTPEFVFDRVTNGFGKMPGWKEVFSIEQRKAVVAYIKSDAFSP
jgi:mono/diheme cytochrome c family protein